MTNKKFKVAAMSMALTACVAAQPLIANAADENINRMTQTSTSPNRKGKARLLHPLLLPVCRPIRRPISRTRALWM